MPESNVVPVKLSFTDDCETPVSALLKLRGEGPCFLLESAERGQVGRYSFIGTRPRSILRWSDGFLTEYPGDAVSAEGDRLSHVDAPDPYRAVAHHLDRYRVAEVPGLPPFAGGAVGLFGYDLVRTVEPLGPPNPDPLGLPDLALMITDVLVIFDHLHNQLTIMACAFADDGGIDAAYEDAAAKIAAVREQLRGPVPVAENTAAVEAPKFESNVTREKFEATVARIVEYIHAGDAFQVVPSQRFSAEAKAEAFSIYRGLRAVNPSPYMYFLEFGDFQVAGGSPEPLLKVNGDVVEIRPIAGTSPRGDNEEEDRRFAEALVNDPKERAEHVMLVDLARNDIGREAVYGSVKVEELMVVETYSHVMHIVSRVTGKLRPGVGALDVLRSALPAGTLSGAPKVRAMQIIDEMETVKRCSYGGAIGYLSWGGDLDTAIHIRTAVIKDGQVHIQAGGGTVADAKPDYEYEESVNKAKAMFRAVELACEHPDWA
ncbi:MAG: anthranilate synthase component I [Solirubrobacterales bacterium]